MVPSMLFERAWAGRGPVGLGRRCAGLAPLGAQIWSQPSHRRHRSDGEATRPTSSCLRGVSISVY